MDYTQILQTLVVVVITTFGPALLVWIVAKIRAEWVTAQEWSPSVTDLLARAAELAVNAAEQFATTPGFQELWNTKKDYALHIAQAYLDARNIKIDVTLVGAAIESAVKSMNDNQPAKTPITPISTMQN